MIGAGEAWTAIALAGAGTFLIRLVFPVAARRLEVVPPAVERALRMIPAAALAALSVPAFVAPGGTVDAWSAELLAGAVATVVAWRTRSIPWTLVAGMAALAALRQL